MMQTMYVPTILLTPELQEQLRFGTVVLKCGQWVRTHPASRPSRWVGVTYDGRSLWAAHYQGAGGHQARQFRSMAQVRRDNPQDFVGGQS